MPAAGLGVNLLGARDSAIREFVLERPPSPVAKALGYGTQVAFLPADKAAEPWARYAGRSHQALSDVRAEMMATVRPFLSRTGDHSPPLMARLGRAGLGIRSHAESRALPRIFLICKNLVSRVVTDRIRR